MHIPLLSGIPHPIVLQQTLFAFNVPPALSQQIADGKLVSKSILLSGQQQALWLPDVTTTAWLLSGHTISEHCGGGGTPQFVSFNPNQVIPSVFLKQQVLFRHSNIGLASQHN